jgi:hypothetical protein
LRAAGFNYADATGNTRLSVSSPGLIVQTTGATNNPEPERSNHVVPGTIATTDADLVLDPSLLDVRPEIAAA